MRYFIHIGFNGRQYRGWQRLPGIVTVQEVIEEAISAILKEPVEIVGCGRTDAMVHATQYFFHFDIEREWDYDFKFRLNKRLPDDIAVFDVLGMEGLPHARFDAISRSYDYFIHGYKDPFLNPVSSCYPMDGLDFSLMQKAVAILPLYNDYFALCKTPTRNAHTICNVSSAGLFVNREGDRMRFQISSNRFLGGMIRIIISKLLEIGSGVLSVDEFEAYLRNKVTPPIIKPALANGLFLSKVTYPYLDIPPRTQFSAINHLADDSDWLVVE